MSAPSADGPVDDLGRELSSPARRIVSLVPSITELLFELGVGDRLVGISRFCTEPARGVAIVERVGGTKDPDCGLILGLAHDLVFLDRDENRIEDFEVFDGAGIPVFVANPQTVCESATTVARIGACVGAGERARQLEAAIHHALERWSARGQRCERPVRVFCPIWRNPWMCFNTRIFAGDLIRQAGGELVCESEESYRRVGLAEVAESSPEVVLLPDEPYAFRSQQIDALGELRAAPAWRRGKIHLVDGKALFWYGARTPAALRAFRAIFDAAR